MELWIKGTCAEAIEASNKRGLILEYPTLMSFKETVGEVDDKDHMKVVEWYCESAECKEGIGYPAGTVLYYSIKQDKPCWCVVRNCTHSR